MWNLWLSDILQILKSEKCIIQKKERVYEVSAYTVYSLCKIQIESVKPAKNVNDKNCKKSSTNK